MNCRMSAASTLVTSPSPSPLTSPPSGHGMNDRNKLTPFFRQAVHRPRRVVAVEATLHDRSFLEALQSIGEQIWRDSLQRFKNIDELFEAPDEVTWDEHCPAVADDLTSDRSSSLECTQAMDNSMANLTGVAAHDGVAATIHLPAERFQRPRQNPGQSGVLSRSLLN